MVILLRSPRRKVEAYVKEFARLGVPLAATGGGFYESLEVRDLLSLLQVLDNPSQDLPLLAVLRSPLVGLTADDLAAIRLAQRKGLFWTALLRWHEGNLAHERVNAFLERFRAWRKYSRVGGVSQLLAKVVEETGYGELFGGGQPECFAAFIVDTAVRQFSRRGVVSFPPIRAGAAGERSADGTSRKAGAGRGSADEHPSEQGPGISHRGAGSNT